MEFDYCSVHSVWALRKMGIENEIEGFEAFCDVYLYEKAPEDILEKGYADIEELIEKNKLPIEERKGVLRFLANVFGIVLVLDDTEKQREEYPERVTAKNGYNNDQPDNATNTSHITASLVAEGPALCSFVSN